MKIKVLAALFGVLVTSLAAGCGGDKPVTGEAPTNVGPPGGNTPSTSSVPPPADGSAPGGGAPGSAAPPPPASH